MTYDIQPMTYGTQPIAWRLPPATVEWTTAWVLGTTSDERHSALPPPPPSPSPLPLSPHLYLLYLRLCRHLHLHLTLRLCLRLKTNQKKSDACCCRSPCVDWCSAGLCPLPDSGRLPPPHPRRGSIDSDQTLGVDETVRCCPRRRWWCLRWSFLGRSLRPDPPSEASPSSPPSPGELWIDSDTPPVACTCVLAW